MPFASRTSVDTIVDYEWDSHKAKSNLRKHGVAFADAVAVFKDDAAVTIPDDEADEQRLVSIGMDGRADFSSLFLLGVANAYRSFQPAEPSATSARNTKAIHERQI